MHHALALDGRHRRPIGAAGLGSQVVRGLNQMNIPLGVEAGTCIVILAIILDRVTRLSHGAHK